MSQNVVPPVVGLLVGAPLLLSGLGGVWMGTAILLEVDNIQTMHLGGQIVPITPEFRQNLRLKAYAVMGLGIAGFLTGGTVLWVGLKGK